MMKFPAIYDRKHGSLYDRGAADSYYGRPRDPHWYPNGTYNEPRVQAVDQLDIREYNEGYDYNERYGDKKSWD
jgi:hypothetical protein